MDSFECIRTVKVAGNSYNFYDIAALPNEFNISRLPYSIKILLENLLRNEDGIAVTKQDIEKVINWQADAEPSQEISFKPSRVILQDFTGVPAVVDLAAMREAMVKLGGDPLKINPLSPVELVIDHSVMVDHFGNSQSLMKNTEIEFQRNAERYSFLKWGQKAFDNFKVVPPGTGIVHQVNLEYLARIVFNAKIAEQNILYPDTVIGTDSHTTMINGIGVLGWGVGGIEAEAAMLGQPITMLLPQVIGVKIIGKLPHGATATDLVLTIVEVLRKRGVVGKFVEFFGDGLNELSLEDKATIANMAPEYGATCGIFPIDDSTIRYLKLTGRDELQIKLVETYAKAQGLYRSNGSPVADYTDVIEVDLATISPSIAGPKRPQDRVALADAKSEYQTVTTGLDLDANYPVKDYNLSHGAVVIAAITSCTNTSNPYVMLAAGIMAKKAVELGLKVKPWVKTSLAPGSKVVTEYLQSADLLDYLAKLGFDLVGYGCTTCIGNSGPLDPAIHEAIATNKIATCAVLSGNRNFEGRIHPLVKHAYLASPPLVVAYAIAGTMNLDLNQEPIGISNNKPIFLADIWPSNADIEQAISSSLTPEMFVEKYKSVFQGEKSWLDIDVTNEPSYAWQADSTYVQHPPYFANIKAEPEKISNITNARVLALLGDSVTTDHISPAGNISPDSPAGKYLLDKGVAQHEFNSYGSRRGNHEVMMRGTFANIRLQNKLVPGIEGGVTIYHPTNEQMSIFDAAMRYQQDNTPLVVIAGSEYGTGSSRDWAAKGTKLLGVSAVISVSFERIHRSNLIGMGVLPLQFVNESSDSLGLDGSEHYSFDLSSLKPQSEITVTANNKQFKLLVRIDTPKEMEYYLHGGILNYVLRQLVKG